MPARRLFCLALLFVCTVAVSLQAETNWPRFRGPLGTGESNESALPVEFGPKDVVWKTDLPGVGQSSPVVWGDKLFLTAATDNGQQRLVF
jgi:hypothetical protein